MLFYFSGNRRRGQKVVPYDSTALLNQLRLEEQQKERELRKQQVLEKKAAFDAYLQELDDWEATLMNEPLKSQMKAMWEVLYF